jgi:hypothetical protein
MPIVAPIGTNHIDDADFEIFVQIERGSLSDTIMFNDPLMSGTEFTILILG